MKRRFGLRLQERDVDAVELGSINLIEGVVFEPWTMAYMVEPLVWMERNYPDTLDGNPVMIRWSTVVYDQLYHRVCPECLASDPSLADDLIGMLSQVQHLWHNHWAGDYDKAELQFPVDNENYDDEDDAGGGQASSSSYNQDAMQDLVGHIGLEEEPEDILSTLQWSLMFFGVWFVLEAYARLRMWLSENELGWTRSVSTQSQTTYTSVRGATRPRFQPLADQSHGGVPEPIQQMRRRPQRQPPRPGA
jgi:hypothetical protein